MKKLTILSVDDEPLALRRVELILRQLKGIDHAGSAGGCEDALNKIEELSPDLLLLDIMMRDGSGFDLLDKLGDRAPAIIFTTAFDHFAVRAFDACAVDYVVKPIDPVRLQEAIERARMRLAADTAAGQMDELRSVVENLRERLREQEPSEHGREMWIRNNNGGMTRVLLEDVEQVTSEDDYIRIHTQNASYLLRQSIRTFEAQIEPREFTRIHRKTLVRTQNIKEIRRPAIGQAEVVLQSGARLKAGRVYAKQLRDVVIGKPEQG